MSGIHLYDFATDTFRSQPPVDLRAPIPPPPPLPETGDNRSAVSRHGVTFTFDQPYLSGQFVNGDWWVVPTGAAVTITSVAPAYDPAQLTHGWMVNPASMLLSAYDGRIGLDGGRAVTGWTPGLLPALPLVVTPGSSVVKAVSGTEIGGNTTGHLPALQTAVVLTVLATAPPSDAFRPGYYGTAKRIFTMSTLNESRLPAVAPPAGVTPPSLDWITHRFLRVQLDHRLDWRSRYMHPADNFRATPGSGAIANYGGDMARDHNDALLRLCLNDATWAEKREALITVLQAGIDWYAAAKAGAKWPPDGGHMTGRKQMVFFAALMFDDADMKTVAGATAWDSFSEVGHVYAGPQRALYGRPEDAANAYWRRIEQRVGKRDIKDPTGQIDGGDDPGYAYQNIVSGGYSDAALLVRLMPGGQAVWNHPAFLEYADRWRTTGVWSTPDTEAARRPAVAARHATRGGEAYRSAFSRAMWTTHRGAL